MNAEEQLKQLKDEIYSTNDFLTDSVIQVFPIEASIGKTYSMIEALKACAHEIRTLVVTRLIEEQERIASTLRETLGDSVLVYNNQHQVSTKCILEANVVIITHEKYKRLCVNKEEAGVFSKDRQLLIIDEHIDLLSYHSININTINDARRLLYSSGNENVGELYATIVAPIKKEIDDKFIKSGNVEWLGKAFMRRDIDEQIKYMVSQLKSNKVNVNNLKKCSIKDTQKLIEHIESLRYYFNTNKLLIDTGEIYSCNLDIRHLDSFNKIILLDASASFVELYKSKMFNVHKMKRVIDHGNTTFIHVDCNTTNMAKRTKPENVKNIENYISRNLCNTDKGVAFASKDERDSSIYSSEQNQIEVVTFAESRGRNDWSTCNKAFVVHTQSLPPYAYIFQFLYYFPEEASNIINDNQSIEFKSGEGRQWTFINNSSLHWLRITDIASNFYQSVKRVDRNRYNRIDNVELHIMCSNKQVVEIVRSQLSGLKEIRYLELNEAKKKEAVIQLADAHKVYDVLSNLSKDECKIKEVREMCGMEHRETFNRALKCMEENIIKLESLGITKRGHKFIVTRAS